MKSVIAMHAADGGCPTSIYTGKGSASRQHIMYCLCEVLWSEQLIVVVPHHLVFVRLLHCDMI